MVTLNLFEMAPMSEYDRYIRSYGKSNARQVGVQSNEDNLSQEAQTEEVETVTRWTQYPPNDRRGCGVSGPDAEEDTLATGAAAAAVSHNLVEFLQRAGRVCNVLLEERGSDSIDKSHQSTGALLPGCDAVHRLSSTLSFLAGRHVRAACFSRGTRHRLLAAYSAAPAARSKDPMLSQGILCVWSLHEPSLPQHILICEGTPTCCCFAPGRDSLVFAATSSGALLVWDLNEAPSLHVSHLVGGTEYLLRCPAFATDGRDPPQSHGCPVVALQAVGGGQRGQDAHASSTGLQLVTLDEDAVMKTWTLMELTKADPSGSQRDLGLRPGSRVKLELATGSRVLATSSNVTRPDSTSAHSLAVFPTNPNRVLVGTNRSQVVNWVRFGRRISPRLFCLSEVVGASEATSVLFLPGFPEYFAAAYSHGEVAIFKTTQQAPLARWSACFQGAAVLSLGFSASRPAVFFALDANSRLHAW